MQLYPIRLIYILPTMKLAWNPRLAIAASQFLLSSTLADSISASSNLLVPTLSDALTLAEPTSVSSNSLVPTLSESSTSSQPTPSREPKVHLIQAGAGGFKFTPPEIHNVSVGDIVSWEFYPPDHSVARAEFGSACVPYEDTGKDKVGFWSETQWVNNTNEVCLSKMFGGAEGILTFCLAYLLQHHHQFDRANFFLLCSSQQLYW